MKGLEIQGLEFWGIRGCRVYGQIRYAESPNRLVLGSIPHKGFAKFGLFGVMEYYRA